MGDLADEGRKRGVVSSYRVYWAYAFCKFFAIGYMAMQLCLKNWKQFLGLHIFEPYSCLSSHHPAGVTNFEPWPPMYSKTVTGVLSRCTFSIHVGKPTQFPWKLPVLLGGSSQFGLVVNNHGDRFCPLRIGLCWTPSIHGLYLSN